MSYIHLTIDERSVIYKLFVEGKSIRFIAETIDRSPSTVSRELKRNYSGHKFKYRPHITQKKYKERMKNCHIEIVINETLKNYIEDKINST